MKTFAHLALGLTLLTGTLLGGADTPTKALAPPPPETSLPPETHVTITARPKIRTEPDSYSVTPHPYTVLVIPEGKNPAIEIMFDPKYTDWANVVNDRDTFTFTLWQSKAAPPGGLDRYAFTASEIETISQNGKIIYDARGCPLHHVAMRRAPIDILYGLPFGDFIDAMNKDFGGGPGFTLGGCVTFDDDPVPRTWGYVCPVCAAHYKAWQAARAARQKKTK